MSQSFVPVQWNRTKWVYDGALLLAVGLYLALYLWAMRAYAPPIDGWILRARAFGTCALLLLSLILCAGPLARLDPRFLPLLYNRRHAGVLCLLLAMTHFHAVSSWYFAFTPYDRGAALLAANGGWDRALGFPFEALGLFGLLILAALAATSHDFWLSFLGPPVWKALHLAIYPAYAAVVAHVMLGAAQDATSPALATTVGLCAAAVAGLHLAAWARGRRAGPKAGAWVEAPAAASIAEGRARVVDLPGGRRAAVWRWRGRLYATSNACAHQNGPLGEGRILDGCATCPWHGFQFRVDDGRSPPPFEDSIPVHPLRREGGRVLVGVEPLPDGTRAEGLPA